MKSSDSGFACYQGKTLLNQTKNLSKSFQDSSAATEGKDLAATVIKKSEKDRTNDKFENFLGEENEETNL